MSITNRPGALAGWDRFAAPSEFPDSPFSR
ncbi:MAG: hypothetical protein JWP29_5019, partial [Rhodoferax sp.]|nr:hypothetical protein [Rhodoferax sp.]